MIRHPTDPSPTFQQLSARVLDSIEAGASVADAARNVGCAPRTVERWIARGREDSTGAYGEFAGAVDEARLARVIAPEGEPLSDDELRLAVSEAARAGSVPAMRLYWEILRADAERTDKAKGDALAKLDELAARRHRGARGAQ